MNTAACSVQLVVIKVHAPLVKKKDGIQGEPIVANAIIAKI